MVKCIICGKDILTRNKNRKYCYDCRKNVALKNWIKNSNERRKKKNKN